MWIMAFDPAKPQGRIIASAHDDAWVRGVDGTQAGWLADNQTIYFLSEASGFMHLYTVPFEGGTARPLTSGEWEVDSVTLSNDKKWFYLTTSEGSPFERHL